MGFSLWKLRKTSSRYMFIESPLQMTENFINTLISSLIMKPAYQDSESKAVDAIKKAIPSSLKQDMLPQSKGMFAELYENSEVFPKHYIASAIDSVGTKT